MYYYLKVGTCSKFCTILALQVRNVRNFAGTGTFDWRSVLGFSKNSGTKFSTTKFSSECSKILRTLRYFQFTFTYRRYQKIENFDTVQVHDLLSGESSVMFEETSNIWGMFFE